jgi:muconolactone D-isomerase
VEFLVRLTTALPPDLPEDRRTQLLAAEAARGRELAQAGRLRHIWRLPGRLANVSVWEAADATELHDVLTSLPLWPWMTVTVEVLAGHPLSEHCRGGS